MNRRSVINKKLPKDAKFNGVMVRPNDKIVDLLRDGDLAIVVCVHGKVWIENGKGCKKCMDHEGYGYGFFKGLKVLKLDIRKKRKKYGDV